MFDDLYEMIDGLRSQANEPKAEPMSQEEFLACVKNFDPDNVLVVLMSGGRTCHLYVNYDDPNKVIFRAYPLTTDERSRYSRAYIMLTKEILRIRREQ